jgi:hypothetical protein
MPSAQRGLRPLHTVYVALTSTAPATYALHCIAYACFWTVVRCHTDHNQQAVLSHMLQWLSCFSVHTCTLLPVCQYTCLSWLLAARQIANHEKVAWPLLCGALKE